MKKHIILRSMLLVALAICLLCSLSACGEAESPNEFEFTGTATLDNGTEYHGKIVGDKDGTFIFTLDEMSNVSLSGTWVKVDSKGYKLYFSDAESSYSYTKYSPDTKDFSLTYTVDLGGGYGSTKFHFTSHNEKFASEYDGVGLGNHPPIMVGGGWGGPGGTTWRETKLTCYEDGTCTSLCTYRSVSRNGTWTFDDATNTYSFSFNPEEYTYQRAVGVCALPGRSEGVDFGTSDTYRHYYWVGDFKNADELQAAGAEVSRAELWVWDEGPRNYATSTWQADGENEIEFKTTYDEATQTYTLAYEQYDNFFYTDRMVSYTLD